MNETGYASVVRESYAQRDGLFGGLLLIFVPAFARVKEACNAPGRRLV